MSRRAERRRFSRRAKSIRTWFEHAGEQHRAVTTIVGLGGAFFKASHLPRPGTVLTMHERFKAEGGGVSLRCEVIWLSDQPSLERPDTGFGVRFLEAVTRADPASLEEFLSGLHEGRAYEIAMEERAHGVYSVYRFPSDQAAPTAEGEHDFAEQDEPAIIDLQGELDRLGREERRDPVASASVSLPTTGQRPRSHGDSGADTLPRTRKKRRITGLFTALFSRQRDAATDNTRTEIELLWEGGSVAARIEALGEHGAAVLASSSPFEGNQLVLRPLNAPDHLAELLLVANVARREGRLDGTFWLSLEFVQVDERGQPGRFLDFVRHINGQNR